jgi:glycine/D-amino acid oxidase-like deaminating enzyme
MRPAWRTGRPGGDRPRVAVIGGGVFGASCAVELGRSCDVTLYERHPEVLTEASALNQWRHHSGFHYPRSLDTIREVRESKADFEAEYEEAIDRRLDAYYAVSSWGSEIGSQRYLAVCQAHGLRFTVVAPPPDIVHPDRIALCLLTDEAVVEIGKLSRLLMKRLGGHRHIDLKLGTGVCGGRLLPDGRKQLRLTQGEDPAPFDFVVNATYANQNRIAGWFGFPIRPLRFDYLELAVLAIPKARRFMMTILDGPFTSLTSMCRDDLFMLSHVHQSILSSQAPADGLPPAWGSLPSNVGNLIRHSLRYLPVLKSATYVESRRCVRTVRAYSEDFDGRPSVVTPHGFGCWSLLGGKIVTAVTNAKEVAGAIERESSGR